MIEVEIFCDRCAVWEKRRMNVSDAIEKLGSFCPKCVTGVIQVRKIEKRKKKK